MHYSLVREFGSIDMVDEQKTTDLTFSVAYRKRKLVRTIRPIIKMNRYKSGFSVELVLIGIEYAFCLLFFKVLSL